MFTRTVGRALLLGGLVSGVIAACAQGGQLGTGGAAGGTSTSSSSSSGTPDAGPTPGTIGSPCKSNDECMVGNCVPIGNASYCTQVCPPTCPGGTYCSIIDGHPLCVPDLDQQCQKCNATTECKLPSDRCMQAPAGDRFCARDCSVDGVCPNGFTCVDKDAYAEEADGGAPDAGTADEDAGVATTAFKWCVPNSGASCPCNAKRDGVSHVCSHQNASGICVGTETCDGAQGQWKGCDAATPAAESCNNKDDDCNGMIDDGDPNALCASQGPKPPHASWACKEGACSLGACDPGWTSYPTTSTTSGCGCPLESGEPNGTCATATSVGMVSDTGGPVTVTGTLSSGADVDFWTFDSVDVDEGTTNSYHVNITFTGPTPNNEFLMDVMRGDPCSDTPTGPSTAITSYDFCVNATDGASPPTGESVCGPQGANHCNNYSTKYYVRVYRRAGATGSCTAYTLTVSGGGGTCDLTQKCP